MAPMVSKIDAINAAGSLTNQPVRYEASNFFAGTVVAPCNLSCVHFKNGDTASPLLAARGKNWDRVHKALGLMVNSTKGVKRAEPEASVGSKGNEEDEDNGDADVQDEAASEVEKKNKAGKRKKV